MLPSRRLDPRAGAALVWGTCWPGEPQNVIPSTGTVSGTLRMLNAFEQFGGPWWRLSSPYGVSAKVRARRSGPRWRSSPGAARAGARPGRRRVHRQSLGGEDCTWYLTTVPGAMIRLGTRTGGRTYDLHQAT